MRLFSILQYTYNSVPSSMNERMETKERLTKMERRDKVADKLLNIMFFTLVISVMSASIFNVVLSS